jgi:plastocyanin
MKNVTKFVMLGLLLVPFVAIMNLGNAYAETVNVTIEPGSGVPGCEVDNKCYDPATVTVPVGTTVVWKNGDSQGHTITSGTAGADTFGEEFDSSFPLMKPEATFEHTFDKVGEFPYFCQVHPYMVGKVIVTEEMEEMPEEEAPEEEMPEEEAPTMEEGKITVTFEDSSFDVMASLSNGKVQSGDIDPDFTSLVLMLETSATDDGELLITLPRELIDAKSNDADDDFIVLVDGDEVDYEEHHTTDAERALLIQVPAGAEEAEIVGSQVVPEFPIAVIAVMGAIIATAIAVSRFKNPLGP